MSADVRTALIQHALNMGDLFAQNAALMRGLPDKPPRPTLKVTPDGPLTLKLETSSPLATATATSNQAAAPATVSPAVVAPAAVSQPSPPAAATPAAEPTIVQFPGATEAVDSNAWLKKAAIVAALATGATGLGTAVGYYLRPGGSTGPTINVQPNDQSLLTWLQEQGYHLPDKQRKESSP